MTNLILITIVISLFCVGLRIISSKDMILYFLRKPYEKLDTFIKRESGGLENDKEHRESLRDKYDEMWENEEDFLREEKCESIMVDIQKMDEIIVGTIEKLIFATLGHFILKPIIGCVTCMASVWTVVWYYFTNGFDIYIITVAGGVAFLNTILYSLYELIETKKKCNC